MRTLFIAGAVAILLLAGGIWWSSSTAKEALSRKGLHLHPKLAIYIKGEQQEIPQNIGVGTQYAGQLTYDPAMRMTAIHTHDDLPLIHLEFSGVVYPEDTTIGNFFRIWGKPFSERDLLGYPSGPEGQVTMYVNGEKNTAFEKYQMRDGDSIELRYE